MGTIDPNPWVPATPDIDFDRLDPATVVDTIGTLLEQAESGLRAIREGDVPDTVDGVLGTLDRCRTPLDEAMGLVEHLLAVAATPELRAAHAVIEPDVAAFHARMAMDPALWAALERVREGEGAVERDRYRRRLLERTMERLRRAGAELRGSDRERWVELQVELAGLSTRFRTHVMDSTDAWGLHVTDEERLDGLPPTVVDTLRDAAREAGHAKGWLVTLQPPVYLAIMEHATDRSLRRTLHRAYMSRATEAERDNRPVLARILELRAEMAHLLGAASYADHRLSGMMAGTRERVESFLTELTRGTAPAWKAEFERLREAAARFGVSGADLSPWDRAFLKARLLEEEVGLDPEALRPYLSLESVERTLFDLSKRLFGVEVRAREQPTATWHERVRVVDLYRERDGKHLAVVHLDWFPRKGKRVGAWYNELRAGAPRPDGSDAPVVAVLAGNFTPPGRDGVAKLTHDEALTIAHEFGHLVHHASSYTAPVAGLDARFCRWDFIEVPSQLMENWLWERELLEELLLHHETKEPPPPELIDRLIASRTHFAATDQMRQLAFATLDLRLHSDPEGYRGRDAVRAGRDVVRGFEVIPDWAENDFLAGFNHIFAGGYAAGYYSYKWSEGHEADLYLRRFAPEGIFDPSLGREYVRAVLEPGDQEEPSELFRRFMGRDPDPTALVERVRGTEAPGGRETA